MFGSVQGRGLADLPGQSTPGSALLLAPWTATVVALGTDGEVIGFAHALSNSLTPYFPELVVAAKDRNHSVARKLLAEIFHRSGAIRLDLISTDTAEGFYETLAHHRYAGFRL